MEDIGCRRCEAIGHALEAEIVGVDAVEEVKVFVVGGDFGFDHLTDVLAHDGEAGGWGVLNEWY